jgi:hypothetical protein
MHCSYAYVQCMTCYKHSNALQLRLCTVHDMLQAQQYTAVTLMYSALHCITLQWIILRWRSFGIGLWYSNPFRIFTSLYFCIDFDIVITLKMSRNISVGIVTGYRIDDRSSIPDRGRYLLPLRQHVQTDSVDQPKSNRRSFPGGKRPEREADLSPLTNAEVKNTRSPTSTPRHVFMARCLLKPSPFNHLKLSGNYMCHLL